MVKTESKVINYETSGHRAKVIIENNHITIQISLPVNGREHRDIVFSRLDELENTAAILQEFVSKIYEDIM